MDRDRVLALLRERIVGFATSRTRRDIAEDLAQEVLLVLSTKYGDITSSEDLVPLAFRILRFKMMAYHRKTSRRGEDRQPALDDLPEFLPDDDPTSDPEAEARRRQTVSRLIAALGELGNRCRQLFRLKLEGRSFREIQESMGARTINTVYTWDHRCRQRLLTRLDGRWTGDA